MYVLVWYKATSRRKPFRRERISSNFNSRCKTFPLLRRKVALSQQENEAWHSDIVAFLATRVQSPTEDDRAKLHKGIGYLSRTVDLSLTVKAEGSIRVTAYIDASFATYSSDMKSHTRVYITLEKGEIYCPSFKQKLVTESYTEAELVGISDALPQII